MILNVPLHSSAPAMTRMLLVLPYMATIHVHDTWEREARKKGGGGEKRISSMRAHVHVTGVLTSFACLLRMEPTRGSAHRFSTP